MYMSKETRMAWKSRIFAALVVGVALSVGVVTAQHQPYENSVVVPRCCQEGFNFNSEHICTADPNKPFHPPAVAGGSPVVIHDVENTDATKVSCKIGEKEVFGNTKHEDTFLIIKEPSLVSLASFHNGEINTPERFCMAREISDTHNAMPNYVAKFCMPDLDYHMKLACADSTCVRKCCASGKVLVDIYCDVIGVSDVEEWRPTFSTDNETVSLPSDLKVIYGFPSCEKLLIYHDHQLLPNGDLLLSSHRVPVQDYCIDNIHDNNNPNSTQEMALACLKNTIRSRCPWKNEILLPILMSISCVFLLITWVVYVAVWQLRTSTTGRCLISFISAMLVAFISLMVLNLHTSSSLTECAVTGRITHFSVLAMFFWLNVMSYQVFSVARSGMKESPMRFLVYSVYGWGCPLLIMMVGLGLDLTEAPAIRPDMFVACWIIDSNAKWIYIYGIILCLLVINIGFFIASIKYLRQTKYSPNAGNVNNNISAWVYFKLFIFTGILWVTDIIFWATTDVGLTTKCDVAHIIFDVVNGLQGVYVFLVAVCLRKDIKVFHCGRPMMNPTSGGNEVATNHPELSELVNNA